MTARPLLGSPVGSSETERAAVAVYRNRYRDAALAPIVVVIAAYQEQATIGRVLEELPLESCGLEVEPLVVVDGATDGTAQVAIAHGARICEMTTNMGQGAALRLGYHLAAQGGARVIVTTDADGQYDASELGRLVEPVANGVADMVTGSRWLGRNETTSRFRRIGSHVFAGVVTVLTRQKITDTSFGFRAMTPAVTGNVELRQPQYQSSELLIGALMQGFRVVERPMTMRTRAIGTSKKGNDLVYGYRYTRVVFGTWRRERARRNSSGGAAVVGEDEAIEEHELRAEHDERGCQVSGTDQDAQERDVVGHRPGESVRSSGEARRQE
jgi:glycosyltransferase involved in cell wall biosynthesis